MNKLEGYGIPTKYLAGEKGDIYTDLDTGKQYECIGLLGFIDIDIVDEPVEYHWKENKQYGGGGASDCDWETMKNKPFGETVVTKYMYIENEPVTFSQPTDKYGNLMSYGYYLPNNKEVFTHDNVAVGDKVIFEIDGVEQEYVIETHDEQEFYFGNDSIANRELNGTCPDAPIFGIISSYGGLSIYHDLTVLGEHKISIYLETYRYTRLEDKYLPETVATVETLGGLPYIPVSGMAAIMAGATDATKVAYATAIFPTGVTPPPVVAFAVGKYATVGMDESIPQYDTIPLTCRVREYPAVQEDGSTYVSYGLMFSMSTPLDVDVDVYAYANLPFQFSMM